MTISDKSQPVTPSGCAACVSCVALPLLPPPCVIRVETARVTHRQPPLLLPLRLCVCPGPRVGRVSGCPRVASRPQQPTSGGTVGFRRKQQRAQRGRDKDLQGFDKVCKSKGYTAIDIEFELASRLTRCHLGHSQNHVLVRRSLGAARAFALVGKDPSHMRCGSLSHSSPSQPHSEELLNHPQRPSITFAHPISD